jgi:hypothetical protein
MTRAALEIRRNLAADPIPETTAVTRTVAPDTPLWVSFIVPEF